MVAPTCIKCQLDIPNHTSECAEWRWRVVDNLALVKPGKPVWVTRQA